ncbi:endonuclease/exonuclease/phosphatase family protein [Roseicyclus sp. F158]|uniref:Endonuclease/exonuclease/phosphatase family protein n=1 Tax=Tropicimonas omnivorans TaxID=3075590 RepID=A0ABU3DIT5_9RHOB|nr:endonuclease/exonuclease/phosphatase family protein [Roseicyclus sp. F158]MDT0683636.1 endonuclease/exonuclease/phosphatase family protein [Roseicyclus sp. F158]
MTSSFRALLAALLSLALIGCAALVSDRADAPVSSVAPGALRMATWNVHYIRLRAEEGDWSIGDWARRRGPAAAALRDIGADIVAFQEMESFGGGEAGDVNLARDDLLEALPGYAIAASGPPASFPNTQPIFYRADRLDALDQGWFFFSETPDVIYSRTYDGSWPAFASWARLRDRRGGPEFTVVNVHFEYRSGSNRTRSARLVAERMAPRIAAGEPVILMGDLNAMEWMRTAGILREAGLVFAGVRGATYHLNRGLNLFGAIDHIAATDGVSLAGGPEVLRRRYDGIWPSDHYPVFADLVLPR